MTQPADPFQVSSQDVQRGPDDRGPLIVGDKRVVLRVGIVFSVLALATAIFLFTRRGAEPFVVALIVLVSVGLTIFLQRLRGAAHVLRVDDVGIDDRTSAFGGGAMPWAEIAVSRVVEADGRPMVGIELTEAARERRGFFTRTIMDEQREAVGCDVILPPEAFGLSRAERAVAFLETYRTQPERRVELTE